MKVNTAHFPLCSGARNSFSSANGGVLPAASPEPEHRQTKEPPSKHLNNLDPKTWWLTLRFLYPEIQRKAYLNGLQRFCVDHNVKQIRDAAGGVGFPAISLALRGFEVTYSDANQNMIEFFKDQLRWVNRYTDNELNIDAHQSYWDQSDKIVPGQPDLILCRGNSLPYALPYDPALNGKFAAKAAEKVRDSLSAFYRSLKPGGLLYVDVFPRQETYSQPRPYEKRFHPAVIEGKAFELQWEITHDTNQALRTLKRTLSKNGEVHVQRTSAYLLTHDKLRGMLKKAGFSRVEETAFPGEKTYDVFIARK